MASVMNIQGKDQISLSGTHGIRTRICSLRGCKGRDPLRNPPLLVDTWTEVMAGDACHDRVRVGLEHCDYFFRPLLFHRIRAPMGSTRRNT